MNRPRQRYCTLAVTAASALSVSVQVFVLLPPLEHAPDQTASRPPLTLNVIDVPDANVAPPLLPTVTLMPAGDEVTRSPLRPDAVTVSVRGLAGGGGLPPASGVNVRTDDHGPLVPALLRPRTRHQCCRMAADDSVNCDAVTVSLTTNGDENALESSTWI